MPDAPVPGAPDPAAPDPEARRLRWEDRTQEPLTVAALLFLVAFVVPLYMPDLPPHLETAITVLSVVVWVLFAVDYAVRLVLAHRRWRFVVTHPLQLALVVLPALRPLAALRLAPLVRVALAATHTTHRARALARARLTAAAVVIVVVLIVVCGGLALQAERDLPDATITGPGEALWWALATVTTVGYGDTYPITGTGRLIASVLMLLGIALLGVISASVVSVFLQPTVEQVDDDATKLSEETFAMAAQTHVQLAEATARLQTVEQTLCEVRAELAALRAAREAGDRPTAGSARPEPPGASGAGHVPDVVRVG